MTLPVWVNNYLLSETESCFSKQRGYSLKSEGNLWQNEALCIYKLHLLLALNFCHLIFNNLTISCAFSVMMSHETGIPVYLKGSYKLYNLFFNFIKTAAVSATEKMIM
jgi:hypothetical protein